MASASIDHMLSLTIFIAALLIFIGFFSQSMQTAITYQQHNAMSTKTSDLLDTLLLTSGIPTFWGQNDTAPAGFGLQDPASEQCKLSPFAPMRLSTDAQPIYYPLRGIYYNNLTSGRGSYILTPLDGSIIQSVTYKRASELLGVNGTYGFHLSLTPTVDVSVAKTSSSGSLRFVVAAEGKGFVLAQANVTYSLTVVTQDANPTPTYTITSGNNVTNAAGMLQLSFPAVDGESSSYALIVYTYLYGLKTVGYYVHVSDGSAKTLVPLIDSFQNRSIRLAHSDSVGVTTPSASEIHYASFFAVVTEEYMLRQIQLDPSNATGTIQSTADTYKTLTLPISDPGILIVVFKDTVSGKTGIELVPWGLGSLAYPMEFGGNSKGRDWVTTDIRQVTIGGIAYQAKLELWNLGGS